MTIAGTLKELRNAKKMTVDKLCAEIGLKRGTYLHYEVGDREPNLEMLMLLADYYSISLDTLFSRNAETEESQLAQCYRRASVDDKYIVWAVLNKYRRKDKRAIERPKREMPLYHLPVSAGTGAFLDSSDFDMVMVEPDVPIASNFGVRISGDSMEPQYKNGGVAWVKITSELRVGDVGVFILNGEGFIKKFEYGRLISLNPAYEPIILSESDSLRTVGKVLAATY